MRPNTKWTAEQDARMDELYDARCNWNEIAAAVGHTKASCQVRMSNNRRKRNEPLMINGPRRPQRPQRPPMIALQNPPTRDKLRVAFARGIEGAPQLAEGLIPVRNTSIEVLRAEAEMIARISVQGITAGLFGDPLPGRSALDRMRAGEIERPYFDHRQTRDPKKPTLAGAKS